MDSSPTWTATSTWRCGPNRVPGIGVYNPDGKEIAFIKTEMPTNVGFGRGADANLLYITAGHSLYRIRLNKEGYRLPARK